MMIFKINFNDTASSVENCSILADDILRLKVNTKKRAFVYILHLKIVTLCNQVRLKEKSYAKFEAASQAYPFHRCEKTVQDAKWPRAL